MDYTVSYSISSKVLERVVLFYLLTDYYLDRYIKHTKYSFSKVYIYLYNSIISLKKIPNILERGSLSGYRCICMALRGPVARLFYRKGLGLRGVLRKWLREGIRESSVSRTEKE